MQEEKKTFVTITQQMLDGEISMDEAVKEIKQLTPPKKHYDYDGLYYEGERKNTFMAMKSLGFDHNTGTFDPHIKQRIRELIDTVIAKEDERKA